MVGHFPIAPLPVQGLKITLLQKNLQRLISGCNMAHLFLYVGSLDDVWKTQRSPDFTKMRILEL